MKKIFFLAALGLSMMAQAVELDYYKTLVDEQANASAGQTQLYTLEYAADGSLYLLSSYQTANSEETGMVFEGKSYKGATASKWGSKAGEQKYTNMRNSFLAKLDAEGNLLWAKADTTGDYDLAGTAVMVTAEGGVIYADKFRGRKGNYMSFINIYDKDGQLLGSNNMALTKDTLVINGKKVARNDAFAWAALAQDAEGYVYLAGYQADTLLPVWNDSIAPRKAWNYSGSKSDNCNTVILKYKPQPGQWPDLAYVGAVINSDSLAADRPLGMHYENGKLYVAGTYKKDANESGIYAACYNTNLEREFIEYHPISATLQFQQTKFENGKIFVCGGAAKGSVTVGEKTIETTGTFNHGLVYIINQADGKALDFDVHAAANSALNITVAAYPTKDGYVAYNQETLNGIQIAFTYDKNMNLVKADTIGQGGGSSTVSVVGRCAAGDQTAVGVRARTTANYYLLGQDTLNFADVTNWYSLLVVLKDGAALPEKDTILVEGLYYELNNKAQTATLIRLNTSWKYEMDDIVIPVSVSQDGREYPVVALGQGALRNTTAKTITFAEGSQVTMLGMQAFQGAVNVQELELPEGIQFIPTTCIHNATANAPMTLKKLVLPASVDSLCVMAFALPQLDTLVFKGTVPPTIATKETATWTQNPWQISTNHANNTDTLAVVVVPAGTKEVYKNTAWIGDYFQIIIEESEAQGFESINANDGKAVKFFENGQLYIRRNGRTYNVQGMFIQ